MAADSADLGEGVSEVAIVWHVESDYVASASWSLSWPCLEALLARSGNSRRRFGQRINEVAPSQCGHNAGREVYTLLPFEVKLERWARCT